MISVKESIPDECQELQEEIKDLNNRLMTCKMSIAIRDTEIKKLKEENEKFKKDIDEMFRATEYGDDIIRDGYTKLDAIYEWANSHADCQQEEIVRLSEENKKLKEGWIKCQNCTNEMCVANEKLEIGYKAMKNSYIAQIKKLKEENEELKTSIQTTTSYWTDKNELLQEEIKKLKEENEKLKKLGEYVCAENY